MKRDPWRPTRLTTWKQDRLAHLWPDPTVPTKDIVRELDLCQSSLQKHARRMGLGHRPTGTQEETPQPRKVA